MTPILEDALTQYADETAFDDGKRQLRFRELLNEFQQYSIPKSRDPSTRFRFAWCPRNDAQAFVKFWAIQAADGVACPISHRFPTQKVAELVNQVDAKWIGESQLPGHRENAVASLGLVSEEDSPATLILTSGSTGVPKAVVHSMRAHIESAKGAATNMPLSIGDRWLWSLPLCHVSGMSILVRCCVAGATVVGTLDGQRIDAALLDRLHISHLSVVSTQLRRLLAEDSFPSKHLKCVLLGGGGVDSRLVAAARQRGLDLRTTYGLTEMASQVCTSSSIGDPAFSGQVLPGREVRIADCGEILVRGDTLCLGYYQAGKIEPVVDANGWFHTGDLGKWKDSGQLLVKGRIDNMFISGGENIYPESIERALINSFGLENVVVVPKPCETFGARPVAFVQGELPVDWEARLRMHLKGYEIPVEIYGWPENANNDIKPNRRALVQQASES